MIWEIYLVLLGTIVLNMSIIHDFSLFRVIDPDLRVMFNQIPLKDKWDCYQCHMKPYNIPYGTLEAYKQKVIWVLNKTKPCTSTPLMIASIPIQTPESAETSTLLPHPTPYQPIKKHNHTNQIPPKPNEIAQAQWNRPPHHPPSGRPVPVTNGPDGPHKQIYFFLRY